MRSIGLSLSSVHTHGGSPKLCVVQYADKQQLVSRQTSGSPQSHTTSHTNVAVNQMEILGINFGRKDPWQRQDQHQHEARGCATPVSRLDCLLDLPSSLILHCGTSSKGDEGHLILISDCDSWDVYKVVDLGDEVVTFPLSFTIVIPQLLKCPASCSCHAHQQQGVHRCSIMRCIQSHRTAMGSMTGDCTTGVLQLSGS